MDFIKRHIREIPLYIIAAGLPLIICFHVQYTGLETLSWFPNQPTWTDFFLLGKSRCIHFLGMFMAMFLLIGAVCKKNARFEREWLLVLLYGILQLVSAFSSAYPQQSFFGGIEQYESVWILLGYLLIGGYAYQWVIHSKTPEKITTVLFLGIFLSCLLGLTQLLQNDFWETEIGKQLLIPQTYAELRENLRFNFAQGDWEPVYLASYNPNYAGIYLLMILPCVFLWENKNKRILGIIVTICMIGTMSKTVIFAAIMLIILSLALFRKAFPRIEKKWIAVLGSAMTVLGIALVAVSGNEADVSDEMFLREVVCEENYVRITYQGETIRMRDVPQHDGGVKYEICYEDGSHVALRWNEESGEMDPYDKNLQGLHFKVYQKDDISYAMFRYGDIPFRFTNDVGTGKYEYVSINGKIDKLQDAATVCDGTEGVLNGRGYIWNRTLAVILENVLLGTGPDTFLLEFPQDDYVVRSNLGHTFFTQILTNAHSLYMHIAMQTGVPSLLCFLGFVLIYLKKSWKLYAGKTEYCFMEKLGIGFFLGVAGYLICGLTFASSVCTTPIFWLLLGLGIGINKIISDNKKQLLS